MYLAERGQALHESSFKLFVGPPNATFFLPNLKLKHLEILLGQSVAQHPSKDCHRPSQFWNYRSHRLNRSLQKHRHQHRQDHPGPLLVRNRTHYQRLAWHCQCPQCHNRHHCRNRHNLHSLRSRHLSNPHWNRLFLLDLLHHLTVFRPDICPNSQSTSFITAFPCEECQLTSMRAWIGLILALLALSWLRSTSEESPDPSSRGLRDVPIFYRCIRSTLRGNYTGLPFG